MKWSTIHERWLFYWIAHVLIHTSTPIYLTDALVMVSDAHDRKTTLTNPNNIHIPPHKFKILKRSFIYSGSVIWKSRHIRNLDFWNVNQFKYKYKTTIPNT